MEIAVTEKLRGKCLKLNFTIMVTSTKYDKLLTTVYNIDNLAEARFKFVFSQNNNGQWCVLTFISLRKHALVKDATVRVQCQDVNCDIPNNARHWLCTENWIDWQEINNDKLFSNYHYLYYSSVKLTVIKEKSFTTAEKFYEDGDLTDFTLKTTDGSVSVHKAWLSAHSDVFKAMLCQEWKETAEGHVKIDGVTLQTLQHLKQYMYLGTLPDNGLRSLLLLAMYYLMDELKSECISKLARTATSEDLDDLLYFAVENKVPELAFAILDMTSHDIVHGAYQLRETKAVSEKEH